MPNTSASGGSNQIRGVQRLQVTLCVLVTFINEITSGFSACNSYPLAQALLRHCVTVVSNEQIHFYFVFRSEKIMLVSS